jgi:uncharacterized membrane-anchored protein
LTEGDHARDVAELTELVKRFNGPLPSANQNHYSADLGPFRVKWERHTEFLRYKFFVAGEEGKAFSHPAIDLVPKDWLAALPGKVIASNHAVLLPTPQVGLRFDQLADEYFDGNALVGSATSGGKGFALTDFRIRADGFGRVMIFDSGLTPRQMGRLVQRIMEIDTYRMMALLTLPVARALSPVLNQAESELLSIMAELQTSKEDDEPRLFDQITRLESQIENRNSDTLYRFSAATAYAALVEQRIEELREGRIEGLQTFREFNDRRFAPAMATCRVASSRLQALTERVARAAVLLSTRVNVTREKQNQSVLKSMDRRANLQLRLQQTVEGLSVAAISYYIVGLVGYAAKGFKAYGFEFNLDLVTASSIPVVVLLVGFGLARFRASLHKDHD